MKSRTFATAIAVGALAIGVTACGDDESDTTSTGSGAAPSTSTSGGGAKLSGQLAGAGSSAQAAAQEAWTAGFQSANSDVTVAYDPVGSGGGREQFNAGGTAFGGSDAAFAEDELAAAQKRCGGKDNLIEVPAYISPIAVAFKLDGVDSLNLQPATIAKIFARKITKWDDAAIKADNPDADLPSTDITTVTRSDESGTSQNFEDFLSKAAASDWTYEVSGDWPVKGGESAKGTSGVIEAISGGDGTIGYADASQAGDLSKAGIIVNGQPSMPTAEAAAKLVEESPPSNADGKNAFVYTLDRQPKDASAYPATLASYEFACTQYDDAKTGPLVKGYLSYILSAEGQKAAADSAGSAPLTDTLLQKFAPAVEAIK